MRPLPAKRGARKGWRFTLIADRRVGSPTYPQVIAIATIVAAGTAGDSASLTSVVAQTTKSTPPKARLRCRTGKLCEAATPLGAMQIALIAMVRAAGQQTRP